MSAIENPSADELIRVELIRRYGLIADGNLSPELGELGKGEARTISSVAKAVNGLRVSGEIEAGDGELAYGLLLDELEIMPDEVRSAQSLIVEGRVRIDFARSLQCLDVLYGSTEARTRAASHIARAEEIISMVVGGADVEERYPRAAEGLRTNTAQVEAINLQNELTRTKLSYQHS